MQASCYLREDVDFAWGRPRSVRRPHEKGSAKMKWRRYPTWLNFWNPITETWDRFHKKSVPALSITWVKADTAENVDQDFLSIWYCLSLHYDLYQDDYMPPAAIFGLE